jgi:hypothetical protein
MKRNVTSDFPKTKSLSPTHNSRVPGQNSKFRSRFLKKKRKRNVSNVPKAKKPPLLTMTEFQAEIPSPGAGSKEKKKKGTLVTFQSKEKPSNKPHTHNSRAPGRNSKSRSRFLKKKRKKER